MGRPGTARCPLLQSLVCGTLLHSRILVGCVMWTYQHCVGMPVLCGHEIRPAVFLIELRQLECHVQRQMLPGAVLFQPKRINAVLIRGMAHLSGSGSRNCPALPLLDILEVLEGLQVKKSHLFTLSNIIYFSTLFIIMLPDPFNSFNSVSTTICVP